MRVIIAGAGRVGTRVAAELDSTHDVVMIDVDTDRIDKLSYDLDVLPVIGDSAAIDTLREASIEETDILVASTDSDEVNIITCSTAKALSDVTTVARVKDVKYIDTWNQAENVFGVDLMVGSNLLTVAAAVGGTGLPAARNFEVFSGGMVQMAQFEIGSDSPIVSQTISEADQFESLTYTAILRGDSTLIPTGETRFQTGDDVIVMGRPESVHLFGTELAPHATDPEEVLIIGGSDIGYHIARLLEDRGLHPDLIEADGDRARELSERLSATTVRNKDPTELGFLERERLTDVDVVVTTLQHDSEENLLAALRAKREGADRTVAVVEYGEHVELFEEAGVDVAVNPRRATALEITEFARNEATEDVALLKDAQVEVIEMQIDRHSVLAGQPLRDLPDGLVIGAITRDGRYVMPRGDTTVEPGDYVVILADTEGVGETIAQV